MRNEINWMKINESYIRMHQLIFQYMKINNNLCENNFTLLYVITLFNLNNVIIVDERALQKKKSFMFHSIMICTKR